MSAFSLLHPGGITLGRDTKPVEIESIVGAAFTETVPGSCFYQIPPFQVDDQMIGCVAYFSGAKLTQISLALADSELYGSGWEDATETKLRRRADDTEKWLVGLGYPQGDYSWGTVWAGFDLKGFSGGGLVTFARPV